MNQGWILFSALFRSHMILTLTSRFCDYEINMASIKGMKEDRSILEKVGL